MAIPTIGYSPSYYMADQYLNPPFYDDDIEYGALASSNDMLHVCELQPSSNGLYPSAMTFSSTSPSHISGSLASLTPTSGPIPSSNSGSSTQAKSRPKQYTQDQWAIHRSDIIALYLKPTKLPEVMRIMEENHGFHGTVAMYKKRLKLWNIKKNMSTAEKEAMLKEFSTHELPDIDIHSLDVRKANKLWRHMRKEDNRQRVPLNALEGISALRKSTKPTSTSSHDAIEEAVEPDDFDFSKFFISPSYPNQSSMQLFETLGNIIRQTTTGHLTFNHYRFSQFIQEKRLKDREIEDYFSCTLPAKVERRVQESLRLLEIKKPKAAQKSFKEVAQLVTRCTIRPTFRFLMILIRTCFYSTWKSNLRYYSGYTDTILANLKDSLGIDHPLTQFFHNFMTHKDKTDVYKAMCMYIVDSIQKYSPSDMRSNRKLKDKHESNLRLAKQCLRRANVRVGDFDEATRLSDDLKQYYQRRGKISRIRECTRFKAQMSLRRGQVEQGLLIYKDLTDIPPSKRDIWACDAAHQIGIHYYNARQYNLSEHHYGQAFHWFLAVYGPTHSETLLAYRDLIDCHRKLKNELTIAALELAYPETEKAIKESHEGGTDGIRRIQDLDMVD